MHNNIEHITLWGPSHSGKTFLIKAFQKKIIQLNDKSKNCTYSLTSGSEFINPTDLIKKPTEEPKENIYIFKREFSGDSYQSKISSHTHYINLLDDKGEDTVNMEKTIIFNLEYSNFLIVVLDPFFIESEDERTSSGKGSGETKIEKTAPIYKRTKDQGILISYVTKLLNHLQSLNKSIFISVCISKIDGIAFKFREPWILIDFLFGTGMKEVFSEFMNNDNFKFNFFSTSAVGYLDKRFEKANFLNNKEEGSTQLEDTNQWIPYNVESPFFWLFEMIERQRLYVPNRNSIKFLSNWIVEERNKDYIPYDIKSF